MSYVSSFNPHSEQAAQRCDAMLARIAQLRVLEERAAAASAQSAPVFHKRGQLLPRERVGLLLDPGAPYLPLCSPSRIGRSHAPPRMSNTETKPLAGQRTSHH